VPHTPTAAAKRGRPMKQRISFLVYWLGKKNNEYRQ
jgi:hypothetical protein